MILAAGLTDNRCDEMTQLEAYSFPDDGRFPNSPLPLLLYRGALPANATAMEQAFEANGWSNTWRNGIYVYHHFHSTAHEVLGIAAGEVQVAFGGPTGQTVEVRAGDVVVIPAGMVHRNVSQTRNLLVIGAYPGGMGCDIRLGAQGERDMALRNISAVPLPAYDPVFGPEGPLHRVWTLKQTV